MATMVAKWGGNAGDDAGDPDDADPSDGGGDEDAGEAPVVAEDPGDPYLLPDGQLWVPFSDDEMPALGDDVPTNNQEPHEMSVLGDDVPTPGNQEPHEMPMLGDDVPTDNDEPQEMPVLGDDVPTDNQEMPVLGDVPTDNQEPHEMPALGDVPTPNNQEPREMPMPTPDKSKAMLGNELTTVATPCVNWKPPPMIERKSHLTSSAGLSSESASPSSETISTRSTLSLSALQLKLARMAELKNLFLNYQSR